MTQCPAGTPRSGLPPDIVRFAHRAVRSSLAGARSMLPPSRRNSLALAAILTGGTGS